MLYFLTSFCSSGLSVQAEFLFQDFLLYCQVACLLYLIKQLQVFKFYSKTKDEGMLHFSRCVHLKKQTWMD